jgi:hypothetical protein
MSTLFHYLQPHPETLLDTVPICVKMIVGLLFMKSYRIIKFLERIKVENTECWEWKAAPIIAPLASEL